jgi:hypothetical protein
MPLSEVCETGKLKDLVYQLNFFAPLGKMEVSLLQILNKDITFVRLGTMPIFSTVNSEAGTEITWNLSESERTSE